MDVAALFESNLELIDRVIARVCHRAGVFGADAEDFASTVRLALIENDYAVLRPFEGRSSLSTFLVVIVQRFLIDQRTSRTGRWHASREAERLGEAGIALERIVRREHRTLEEALPIVQAIDPTLTRERVAEMEARLPERAPRPRPVDLEAVEFQLSATDRADDRVLAGHVEQLAGRAGQIVRETLAAMPLEDRMIIRFHFGEGMTIADISGLLRLPQRPLYRRVESLVKRLRMALTASGFDAGDAADLIGATTAGEIDLGLRGGKSDAARQTNAQEAG